MSEKGLEEIIPEEDRQEDNDLEITEESKLEDTSDSENDTDTPTASKGNEKRQKWSKHCKLLLLKALKKYGHHDIQQIWKALPNKSLASIRAMIHKIKAKSRDVYKNTKPPLNDWIKSQWLPEEESMIPQALLFIRLFEKHPTHLQESSYDFKAVYHYLYNLMLGCPAQDIPKNTEDLLYILLCKVAKNVSEDTTTREDILNFFRKRYTRKKTFRTYPGQKKISFHSSECPSELQNSVLDPKSPSN